MKTPKALPTIRLKDPTRFADPFKLNYNKYVKTQYERVRLHETLTGPHRDERNDRELDPTYLPFAKAMGAISYGGEYSAYCYAAKAAHLAPFRSFREACSYQSMDELRHSQMDWGRLRDLGMRDFDEFTEYWHSDGLATIKRAFDNILALEDSFQIIFTANFVFEGAAATSFFPNMVHLAEGNGDHITSVVNWTRFQDEVRHVAFARAMVQAIVEDDDRNIKTLELWQEAAFETIGVAIQQAFGWNDIVPVPYKSSGEWMIDGLMAYAKQAEKAGITLPELDTLFDAAPEVPLGLDALKTHDLDTPPTVWEDGENNAGGLEDQKRAKSVIDHETTEEVPV
jgi:hypothetical protein